MRNAVPHHTERRSASCGHFFSASKIFLNFISKDLSHARQTSRHPRKTIGRELFLYRHYVIQLQVLYIAAPFREPVRKLREGCIRAGKEGRTDLAASGQKAARSGKNCPEIAAFIIDYQLFMQIEDFFQTAATTGPGVQHTAHKTKQVRRIFRMFKCYSGDVCTSFPYPLKYIIYPRLQFQGVERLHNVIIGSGLKALYSRVRTLFTRQYHHRNGP